MLTKNLAGHRGFLRHMKSGGSGMTSVFEITMVDVKKARICGRPPFKRAWKKKGWWLHKVIEEEEEEEEEEKEEEEEEEEERIIHNNDNNNNDNI